MLFEQPPVVSVVSHRPCTVPGVDAIEDARQFPVAQCHVGIEVSKVSSGPLGVAGAKRLAAEKSGGRTGGRTQGRVRIVRLWPVDEKQTNVGEWVAEGTQLPVEDGNHLAGCIDHGVVESVVAVHDRHAVLFGEATQECIVHIVDRWNGVGTRLLELTVPTLELSFHIPLSLAEVTEAHRIDIDAMEIGENIGHRFAGADLGGVGEQVGIVRVPKHQSIDVGHDVKGPLVHVGVGTKAQGRSNRNRCRTKGADDAILAGDVMSGGEEVAERWTAKNESMPVGIGDQVRIVRATAGDERELERGDDVVDVLDEPLGHRIDVDARKIGAGGVRRRAHER